MIITTPDNRKFLVKSKYANNEENSKFILKNKNEDDVVVTDKNNNLLLICTEISDANFTEIQLDELKND